MSGGMSEEVGFKLFRKRKDGSLGPLFINRKQRIEVGVEYQAEDHKTRGYAHRPGWHLTLKPEAPHLKKGGRVWCKVAYTGGKEFARPECQGGRWVLAKTLKVLEVLG